MFTTADLPAALRLDPDAPHICGHAGCQADTPTPAENPGTGVPSLS